METAQVRNAWLDRLAQDKLSLNTVKTKTVVTDSILCVFCYASSH